MLPDYVNNEKNDDKHKNSSYSSPNGIITGACAFCRKKKQNKDKNQQELHLIPT